MRAAETQSRARRPALAGNDPLLVRYTRLVLTDPVKTFVRQYLGHSMALETLAAVHRAGTRGR